LAHAQAAAHERTRTTPLRNYLLADQTKDGRTPFSRICGQNVKPVFEEDQKQNVLLDYKVHTNSSISGPEDRKTGFCLARESLVADQLLG
jgi:hypothetical protein